MPAFTNAFRFPSRQAVLATSVGLDVFWRLPEDVLAPALSLLGGFLGSPAVATLTSWVMFAAALYSLAHLAYPQDHLPKERPGFRLGFAAGTLPFAYVVHSEQGIVAVTIAAFATLALAGAVQLAYLRVSHGWRILDADGPVADVLVFAFPKTMAESTREEIGADLSRDGALGALGTGLYVVAVAFLLSLPCIAAGIAVVVLFDTFPIPDLLFLAWALAGVVVPRLNRGPSQSWIDDRAVGFEESLLDSVENLTRSDSGLVLGLFTLVGLFGFGLFLYYALAVIPAAIGATSAVVDGAIGLGRPEASLRLWNTLGLVASMLFSGGFGLWAWMRSFRRLPHYLDDWEGRTIATGRPVARPPGFLAVALVGMLLGRWYLYRAPADSPLFAVGWPLLVAFGFALAVRTRTMAPQTIRREDVVVTVGLLAEMATIWTLGVQAPLTRLLSGGSVSAQFPAVVCGGVVFLWLLPKLLRATEDADRVTRLLPSLSVMGLGLAIGLRVPSLPAGEGTVYGALGGFCLVAGALWTAIRWYDL